MAQDTQGPLAYPRTTVDVGGKARRSVRALRDGADAWPGLQRPEATCRVWAPGSTDSPGGTTAGAKEARQKTAAQETTTAFVELVPPQRACWPECIVELEHPRGAKMRIHLKGAEGPDLAALSRSFWGIEA